MRLPGSCRRMKRPPERLAARVSGSTAVLRADAQGCPYALAAGGTLWFMWKTFSGS